MLITRYGGLSDPAVIQALAQANNEPEKWSVYLVKENGATRTEAQNRLYRVVLRKLAQQLGRDVSYWNDFLAERFLGLDEVSNEEGFIRKVVPTTGDLSVEEFAGYLNACLVFCTENHIR